jgi:dTDP-4-dehydrorhamnose reductase
MTTNVLIAGASGLVGRAMARRLPGARALTHAELDITDAAAVGALRADVIYNCAVVGVEQSERDPERSQAVNVRGPMLLSEVADRLHFSTNYVGGVYGRTKRDGERYATTVIRTSWVFGPGKNNFFSTLHRRLACGERVRAAADVFASVTYVEHLAARAVEIDDSGIFNVANEGVCSPYEFACEAARLVGADPSLVESASAPHVVSPIVTDPPLAPWRLALAEFIESARYD